MQECQANSMGAAGWVRQCHNAHQEEKLCKQLISEVVNVWERETLKEAKGPSNSVTVNTFV